MTNNVQSQMYECTLVVVWTENIVVQVANMRIAAFWRKMELTCELKVNSFAKSVEKWSTESRNTWIKSHKRIKFLCDEIWLLLKWQKPDLLHAPSLCYDGHIFTVTTADAIR